MMGVLGRRGDGERREERVWLEGGAIPSRCWWRDLPGGKRGRECECVCMCMCVCVCVCVCV